MSGEGIYHVSVLLNEAVDGLCIRENGVYVDATFGGGGHSRLILERLGPEGKLIAFDQDADAWANKPEDPRLIPVTENFRHLKRFLKWHGYPLVDGILADLGVSSHQFDTPERGFSIRYDGPLDMRMDQRIEKTAAEILQSYSEEQLWSIFERYGEVRNAKSLAKHIREHRNNFKLNTMEALKQMIAPVVRGNPNRYMAQVFQALRMEVNDEMGALEDFLSQAVDCLHTGGRLCVITFHSIEDRMVKRFFKHGNQKEEIDQIYGVKQEKKLWQEVNKKAIIPSEEEQKINPRSTSAKLRIAEKL
jgi:16S rRNA (cytosine1402-N4)-methyltransferase